MKRDRVFDNCYNLLYKWTDELMQNPQFVMMTNYARFQMIIEKIDEEIRKLENKRDTEWYRSKKDCLRAIKNNLIKEVIMRAIKNE